MSAVSVSGLCKSYPKLFGLKRQEVLRGIDLELSPGATLGLVGPNGSGKSTLLRILAGVERRTRGDVKVLGRAADDDATLARTGYLPEDSPFPPELGAEAALVLLGTLAGLSARDVRERGRALLERVGLGEARARRLGAYSRGMLRRFGLAQAWLHDPELIFLDEPTAGLDAQGFEVLDGLVREARERGRTVVISSHLLTDLSEYCTELCVLLDGAIAARGTPDELLEVEGRLAFELEGLAPERLGALEAWVEEHGASLIRSRPASTLLELYRKVARRDGS